MYPYNQLIVSQNQVINPKCCFYCNEFAILKKGSLGYVFSLEMKWFVLHFQDRGAANCTSFKPLETSC